MIHILWRFVGRSGPGVPAGFTLLAEDNEFLTDIGGADVLMETL